MHPVEAQGLPEKNTCKQCTAYYAWRHAQILPNIFNTLLVLNLLVICYNLYYVTHLIQHAEALHEVQSYARRTIAADEAYATTA